MRTASLVLGIVGGVFGILAGLLAMTVGGIGSAFEAEGSGSIVGLGFAAIMLGVLGIVGGSLSNRSPGTASLLQAIAGVLGFIVVSLFWVLAGMLLLVGGVAGIPGPPIGSVAGPVAGGRQFPRSARIALYNLFDFV